MIISSETEMYTKMRDVVLFLKECFVLTYGTDTTCIDSTWKEEQDAKSFLPFFPNLILGK